MVEVHIPWSVGDFVSIRSTLDISWLRMVCGDSMCIAVGLVVSSCGIGSTMYDKLLAVQDEAVICTRTLTMVHISWWMIGDTCQLVEQGSVCFGSRHRCPA